MAAQILGADLMYRPLLLSLVLMTFPHANGAVRALVIAGLGGEPAYEAAFEAAASDVAAGLGSTDAEVALLTRDDARADNVRRTLEDWARTTNADDIVLIAFIGHGSFDGEQFRFNVPGADFNADSLAGWLNAIDSSAQVVVIASSASGAAHGPLAHPSRTILTATRSGGEKNATRFHQFFAAALSSDAADIDKDGSVTMEEAYNYTETHLKEEFDQQGQLLTEHAKRSGPASNLMLARVTPDQATVSDAALNSRLDLLERAIVTLTGRKHDMDSETYFTELKLLLLQMAEAEQQRRPFAAEEVTRVVQVSTSRLGTGLLPELRTPAPVEVEIELPRIGEQDLP
ncbi:MAG: hypothetical protein O2780_18650 [Proteobacteria bacterium]|nr:hypothetical protein [Pseudomonadota bacterium]